MANSKPLWISVIVVLVSVGCASNNPSKMSRGGMASATLYQNARDGGSREKYHRFLDVRRAQHMIMSQSRYESHTRDAMNETSQLFSLLPNPKISIYVYPHMSTRDNAPVPGYTTAVSLYASDQYALPDEIIAQGMMQPEDADVTPEAEDAEEAIDALKDIYLTQRHLIEVNLIRDMNRSETR